MSGTALPAARRLAGAFVGLLLLAGLPGQARAQSPLPEGVTAAQVAQGEQLFKSAGLCFACHGMDGKGMPGAGPSLVDDAWVHVTGGVDEIAGLVLKGIGPEETESGVIMPPKGGSQLSPEQIRAVAAYLWTLRSRANTR